MVPPHPPQQPLEVRGVALEIGEARGGHLVAQFGAPGSGRQSIQIELNRGLYMDEARFERSQGFDALQRTLTTFVDALGRRLGAEDEQRS